MKRLLLLAVVLLAAGLAFADGPGAGPQPGAYGNGPMGPPMAHRMAWHKDGGHPMGPPVGLLPEHSPALEKLAPEKREALHKLQLGAREKLILLGAQMETKHLELDEALRSFPIDTAKAKQLEAAMSQVLSQMTDMRVQTLAQAQQIIGKDAWTALQAERAEHGHDGWRGDHRRRDDARGMRPGPDHMGPPEGAPQQ